MKFFQSELGQSYKTYSFAYCNYVEYETGDQLSELYDKGYLPYTGTKDLSGVFYMARSLRVDLNDWQLNSENRRINRKFEGQIQKQTFHKTDFPFEDERFLRFCEHYFEQRHGSSIMPRERLILVLTTVTEIAEYSLNSQVLGYVFLVSDEHMSHYWYSFYDLNYVNQSLGLWLMTDAMLDAKDKGKKHFYLGTAYGEKGLYKTNYNNLEYWNGLSWSRDISYLRDRCRSDGERAVNSIDEWKLGPNHELF